MIAKGLVHIHRNRLDAMVEPDEDRPWQGPGVHREQWKKAQGAPLPESDDRDRQGVYGKTMIQTEA